ncbi:MAG: hypothetical protein QGF36_02750 [Candidatus Marinimicrobia bacterium]|nr:hypothetical protein [Candidatus Neomarinimicrobiota bacterium]
MTFETREPISPNSCHLVAEFGEALLVPVSCIVLNFLRCNPAKFLPMYFMLTIASWKFQIFPRKIGLFFGRLLGDLVYFLLPFRKSYAGKNLEIAFPDWTAAKRKKVLRNCYQHFGMVLVDVLRMPKFKRKNDQKTVRIPQETIDLCRSHNGGILLSAHIGNWEFLGPALGLHKIKIAGVTRVQRNSKSDTYFNEMRSSETVKTIPFNAGGKVMVKAIKEGYFLGLISDQNAGGKGTPADFFTQKVSVPKGAAVFHLKTNTPILLGFCILSKDLNYDLSFQELDVKGLPDNSEEAIIEINRRYTAILETVVRNHPQQYFWFHRKYNLGNYKGLSRF